MAYDFLSKDQRDEVRKSTRNQGMHPTVQSNLARIEDLARRGQTPMQIAQTIGVGQAAAGEVQRVMDMMGIPVGTHQRVAHADLRSQVKGRLGQGKGGDTKT